MQNKIKGYYSVHKTIGLLYEAAEENTLAFMKDLYDCEHEVLFSEKSPFYNCEKLSVDSLIHRKIDNAIYEIRKSDSKKYSDIFLKSNHDNASLPEYVKENKHYKYKTNPKYHKKILLRIGDDCKEPVEADYLKLAIRVFPNQIAYHVSYKQLIPFIDDDETKLS